MKHVKLFVLAVLAGTLLMALIGAGTATGAPNFCVVQESPCKEANRWAVGTTLDFSLKSGTNAKLASTAGETLEECTGSTLKGKIEKSEPVTVSIETLTWSGCFFAPAVTTKLGKIKVKYLGTHNGTAIADTELAVTFEAVFFGSCIYGITEGSNLGELKEGKPAALVFNAVAEKRSGSAFVCPETAKWTAEYTLTEPKEKTLSVETN